MGPAISSPSVPKSSPPTARVPSLRTTPAHHRTAEDGGGTFGHSDAAAPPPPPPPPATGARILIIHPPSYSHHPLTLFCRRPMSQPKAQRTSCKFALPGCKAGAVTTHRADRPTFVIDRPVWLLGGCAGGGGGARGGCGGLLWGLSLRGAGAVYTQLCGRAMAVCAALSAQSKCAFFFCLFLSAPRLSRYFCVLLFWFGSRL